MAPLLWLRGCTTELHTVSTVEGAHDVTIDLPTYLDRVEATERYGAQQALESLRVGLAEASLPATVWLDGQRRVVRLVIQFPPGVSPFVPVAFDEQSYDLELVHLDRAPAIPIPDARMRTSASDFLHATARESRVSPWRHEA